MKNNKTKSKINLNLQIGMILLAIIFSINSAQAADYMVINNNDSGAGSLRQAILDANASADDDTINFDASLTGQRITLTSGELRIANNGKLTINGLGAAQLSVSGNNASRVFYIEQNAVVEINAITITGGNTPDGFSGGGGIFSIGNLMLINSTVSGNSAGAGGGIDNQGTLTLNNSTLSNNSARDGAGLISSGGIGGTAILVNSTISSNAASNTGGGIFNVNRGTMTIINSTISENTSGFDSGGINNIHNGSTVKLINSTVSNNSAMQEVGGIRTGGSTTMMIFNSTISGNSQPLSSAGIVFSQSASVTLNNTIVADSSPGSDCLGGAAISYSLIKDGSCGVMSGVNNNRVGDPLLGPLQDNGGATFTHAILTGSPAINAGSNNLAVDSNNVPLTTDQRGAGFPRVIGASVDIGAFEFQPPPDSTPPVISPSVSGTLGSNSWYVSDITVSWSVTDDESAVSNQSGCEMETITSDTAGVTFTCTATSDGGTASQSVTVKRDATAPQIAFVSRTAPNSNGWNNTNVVVNWNCSDALSGAVSPNVSQTLSVEGAALSATGTCFDNAGNAASDTQNGIRIDKTAPVLNPTISPSPVILNAPANASANASDALSGIASQSCGAIDTSAIGNRIVSCTAADVAGNTAAASINYSVVFNFRGFLASVSMIELNMVRAGANIPIRFSLNGFQGLTVISSATSKQIPCSGAGGNGNGVPIRIADSIRSNYNGWSDTYNYEWITENTWRGTCRRLAVTLIDGTTHTADFQFK